MEVASDGKYPMIGGCQVDVIVSVVAETKVQLQTIRAKVVLIGEFSTITLTATKAATDVLCVGSKGQA